MAKRVQEQSQDQQAGVSLSPETLANLRSAADDLGLEPAQALDVAVREFAFASSIDGTADFRTDLGNLSDRLSELFGWLDLLAAEHGTTLRAMQDGGWDGNAVAAENRLRVLMSTGNRLHRDLGDLWCRLEAIRNAAEAGREAKGVTHE